MAVAFRQGTTTRQLRLPAAISILLGTFALAVAEPLDQPLQYDSGTGISTLAPWIGRAVRTGDDPTELTINKNQAEPHLARSRLDPDLLIATFQEGRYGDGGAQSNGFAISEDGGFSWRRALFPGQTFAGGGAYFRGTDPVVGFDHLGNLYHNALVAVNNDFSIGEIITQTSSDRGLTWSPPVSVYRGSLALFPDKNWMTVNDFLDTPTTGRVATTWTLFGGSGLPIYMSTSDTQGASWSVLKRVTPVGGLFDDLRFQGSQPAFLPDGKLIMLYHRFAEGADASRRGSLEMAFSADGGEKFSTVRNVIVDGYWLYADSTLRNGGFLPSLAVSRASGEVFITYQARYPSLTSSSRIMFVRSTKVAWSGISPDFSWSTPVPIDEMIVGSSPMFPTISVSADGQDVVISYYTRRNAPTNPNRLDLYVAASHDGGQTWSKDNLGDTRITRFSFDVTRATHTSIGYMIGDYFGAVAPYDPEDAFVLLWIDTSTGNSDPWTMRVNPARADDPWAAWKTVNFSLREQAEAPVSAVSDSDGDGLFDRLEFALGFDPRTPDLLPRDGDALTVGTPTFDLPPADEVSQQWLEGSNPLTATPAVATYSEASIGEGFWKARTYPWNAAHTLEVAVGDDRYLLSAHPFPWLTCLKLDEDWLYSNWMGWIAPKDLPWALHYGLGWLYTTSSDPNSLWFYSPDLGWLYMTQDGFPYVYSAQAKAWWYYFVDTREPRYFYDFAQGKIIER